MQTTSAHVIEGGATPAGTRRYHDRVAARFVDDFARLFASELTVASIGVGTYLGECDDAEDARYATSIEAAIGRGINLVDTAINYRCQRSERAVGRAVRAAVASGRARRDEIVVCTKGGYLPLDGTAPASREAYQAYLEHEFFGRGVMTAADVVAGGHCLTPGYLAQQIAASRANLGLERIDVYYLHNPEQQLEALDAPRFRALLRDAFALLESRVERGEIGCYGCATWNGFRVPPGARGHLSLAELLEVAREVAGEAHHFRVVQLPINLAMGEAVRLPTQLLPSTGGGRRTKRGATVPLLAAAVELGISVVASAPLMQAQLILQLPPQLRYAFPTLTTDAQRAIAFVRTMPGVCAALVGMRQPEHLEENLAAVERGEG